VDRTREIGALQGAIDPASFDELPTGSPEVHEVRHAFCERLFQSGQFEVFLLQVVLNGTETAAFLIEPSCTKTVPKPYVIAASGLTSSEKQIPRNC
jgi:hypothetical protein